MRASNIRRIDPATFVTLYVFKKLTVYRMAEHYGWGRVYRFLAKGTQNLSPNRGEQIYIRRELRNLFRFPSKVVGILNDSVLVNFISQYAKLISENSPVSVPPFMKTVAQVIVKEPATRIMNMFIKKK